MVSTVCTIFEFCRKSRIDGAFKGERWQLWCWHTDGPDDPDPTKTPLTWWSWSNIEGHPPSAVCHQEANPFVRRCQERQFVLALDNFSSFLTFANSLHTFPSMYPCMFLFFGVLFFLLCPLDSDKCENWVCSVCGTSSCQPGPLFESGPFFKISVNKI